MVKVRSQEEETAKDVVSKMVQKKEPVNLNDMPLNSLGDYLRYNKEARKINKELRILRYPIKQCPVELHPTERVVFGRVDQPNNPLPVFLSNEYIEYSKTLYPGQTYDLPRIIVEYLSQKGNPIWKVFDNPDGSREARKVTMEPRFSLRTIYDRAG